MNGSIIVGGWVVLMLVAAAACGEDSAPQEVSAPTRPDTSSNGTNGNGASAPLNPAEANPAPSAGETDAVPSQSPSTGGEDTAPPLDLAPSVPAMSEAPAGAAGSSAADDSTAGAAGAAGTPAEQWRILFNGQNLDGWTVSHCGGSGMDESVLFGALTNWVEAGVEPDHLVTQVNPTRTRKV